MLLEQVLTSLCSELSIEPITRDQYRRALTRFSELHGRPATVSDLTIENLNRYLLWITDRYSLGPTSVCNHRTGIIRIWSFCHEPLHLIEDCPTRRIRRPKMPEKPVVAWKLPDVALLLDAARQLTGRLRCGIPATEFATALIWVAYDTGLRPSDLRLLKWSNLQISDGGVTLSQHKTGKTHAPRLGPKSLEALEAIRRYNRDRIFPLGKTGVWKWEQAIYKIAIKNGFNRVPGKGIGTLRKTHATEVYKQHGLAAAAQSLGHYGATSTARKHYIDSSVQRGHLPPLPNTGT